MSPRPHVLVVTAVPLSERDLATLTADEVAEYNADPDREYSVECPGIQEGGCNTWYACGCEVSDYETEAAAADMDPADYAAEADCKKDGEPHRMFSWGLTTPSGRCYVSNHDSLYDAAGDLGRLEPGRYPVDFDVQDESDLYLTVIPESVGV